MQKSQTNLTTQPQTLMQVVSRLRTDLTPVYGHGEAEAMIRLIFEHLKGWSPVDIIINEPKPLSEFMLSQIDKILVRLKKNEPIQYILGMAYFYGMNFKVGPGVLIPRPETEELIDAIVGANKQSDLRVLDICTGSGCIAVALARNLPFAEVDALDISGDALVYAHENARDLKTRINLIKADIFTWNPEPGVYDIMVANPPYIDQSEIEDMAPNVVENEPHEALFVPDDDPLRFYRRIAKVAAEGLKPGGRVYFEINPRHASELKELFISEGFENVDTTLDIHARLRYLRARLPEMK